MSYVSPIIRLRLVAAAVASVAAPSLTAAQTIPDEPFSPPTIAEPLAEPALLGDGISEPQKNVGTLKHEHRMVINDDRSMGKISLANPVTGDLVAAPETTLTFVNLSGETVRQVPLSASGLFDLSDVPDGVYGVVAGAEEAIMAFGVVVDRDVRAATNVVDTGNLAMNGAAVASEATPLVRSLVTGQLSDADAADIADVDPIDVVGYERGLDQVATPFAFRPITIGPDNTFSGRVVALDADGRATIPRETEVSLVRNNQLVGTTLTDSAGEFLFADARPGVYGCVCQSMDGFAIFSIQLEASPVAAFAGPKGTMPVAMLQGAAPLSVGLAPPSAAPTLFPSATPTGPTDSPAPFAGAPPFGAPPAGAPAGGFAGGGAGGGLGAAGGGGGLGAGGRLGGLLGLAGLAAGLVALADDDDDDRVRAASPSTTNGTASSGDDD